MTTVEIYRIPDLKEFKRKLYYNLRKITMEQSEHYCPLGKVECGNHVVGRLTGHGECEAIVNETNCLQCGPYRHFSVCPHPEWIKSIAVYCPVGNCRCKKAVKRVLGGIECCVVVHGYKVHSDYRLVVDKDGRKLHEVCAWPSQQGVK